MMKAPALLFFLFCCISARTQDRRLPVHDTLAHHAEKNKLILPIVIRSLETNWGFGGVTAVFFKGQQPEDTTTRTSDLSLLALYTLKKQLILVVNSTVFFPHENNILRFQASYSYYPDHFWGLGNSTAENANEGFSQEQFFINPQYLKRINKKFYLGISYEFQVTGKIDYIPGGVFDKENIAGRYGGKTSGIGPLVTWDTRNSAYSPTHGTFAEMQYIFFENATASDFHFRLFNIDLRHFISVTDKSVLALQAISGIGAGNVPFRKLEELGGSDMMRGYYGGRYTDQCLVAGQAEFRQFLLWRIGVVGFASMGEVAHAIDGFSTAGFHYAWGGGLRLLLSKNEKLNLRIDYGIGSHSTALNLQIREAF
jgi:outer membrane protein assembly factor BamA